MAGSLTSTLVVRLLDQVTGPARTAGRSLLGLNKAASGASGAFGARLGAAIERNNRALDQTRGRMIDAVAGFYSLKAAIGGPVKAAMEFESAMSDVRKVVDFPTPQAFKDFQQALVDLSKRVPLSVNGLAQIAAAAGQAGIAGDDLIKFTEAAAKVGVAFDISADEAGDAMAKLMTGLGLSIDQAVSLTDAMNHLSNAQASSAAEVLDVVRRVGAQAKQFGFTAEQVAAFGSAMVAAGSESDVAATSFRNMGLALTKGASATKAQRGAYERLGLSSKQVAKSMQKDAVGTTLKVMEAIAKLPKDEQASISSDLFGNEARALPILLTNLGLLKDSLGLISDETKYAGSAQAEFEKRADTSANTFQTLGNRVTAFGISIGNALIPALKEMAVRFGPVVDRMAAFVDRNQSLIRAIGLAAAGLISFKIATTALTFAGLLGRGGALSMLSIGCNSVGRAAIGATRAARSAVALQTALGAMSGMKLTGLQTIGTALRGIVFAVPGVSAISGALTAIGGALAAVSAPAWLAIGAAVAVVAGAGALLYKYWDRVSSIVSGVARRIGEELRPALDLIRPALDFVSPAIAALGDAFSSARTKIAEFGSWIASFFSKEVLSDEQKAGFEKAGYDVADAMINSIKSAFHGLIDWFKTLPSRIVEAIGNIDISRLIKWPSLPSWMGGGSSTPSTPPAAANSNSAGPGISGHRATGGNVWPGGSFLVGDGGEEEIFRPKTAGTITPVSKAGGGGGIHFGDIIIQGASNQQETARVVLQELDSKLAGLLRGSHADSGAYG